MQDEVTILRNRIAELHKQIKYRDNTIEELEQELLVKDEIIRKQVIMLAEKFQMVPDERQELEPRELRSGNAFEA